MDASLAKELANCFTTWIRQKLETSSDEMFPSDEMFRFGLNFCNMMRHYELFGRITSCLVRPYGLRCFCNWILEYSICIHLVISWEEYLSRDCFDTNQGFVEMCQLFSFTGNHRQSYCKDIQGRVNVALVHGWNDGRYVTEI
jgi:hypothetical protein